MFAPLYNLISRLTGREIISLELVTLVDQESAHSITAMEKMGKYGAMYLNEARKRAYSKGYLVASAEWRGIIHPDNFAVLQNAVGWIV